MPTRLISLDGHPDIVLAGLLTVVGRHPECDARVDSSRVSKRHCCLGVDHREVIVRDLGSTNGTWINGRRISEGCLHGGDELSIAHLRYRLEMRHVPADDPYRSGPRPTPRPTIEPAAPLPDIRLYDRPCTEAPAQPTRCDSSPEV